MKKINIDTPVTPAVLPWVTFTPISVFLCLFRVGNPYGTVDEQTDGRRDGQDA